MRVWLLALALAASGCSTITFKTKNPEAPRRGGEFPSEWHHSGVVNLVELSPPVDLTDRCGRGARWAWVKTQVGPAQAIVCVIGALGVVYCPWEVEVACGR
jgi:hypothetical protein